MDGPEKTLPIVVRKMPDGSYEIVDGEHRWAIAKELGWAIITAIECEADDVQSRALCIGYNRLRGRLNWIKFYGVVKKDLDAGIDLAVAYGEVLSSTELEWVLSLGNLVPKARLILEDSLKRYPEYSLEQLYMLSLFPVVQQESLIERFKTPIVLHVLRQTLAPFLLEKEQASSSQKEKNPSLNDKYPNADTFADNQKEDETDPQPTLPLNLQQTISKQNSLPPNTSNITPTSTSDQITDLTNTATNRAQEAPKAKVKAQTALLLAVSYDCVCGRHYSANFKRASIVVQKENLLFDYVDFKPRAFQVYCDKCNSDHEFTVEGLKAVEVQIFCRRCKPTREGLLNINTGEVTWHDN
ncbi:MAG: ParB N-terminal domain-containing protein [Candidatus Bathyarchaeota archaeon]|nr:ParB N-terminal domain-containing protein [Candidatus Termiticorpusculum sp.]